MNVQEITKKIQLNNSFDRELTQSAANIGMELL